MATFAFITALGLAPIATASSCASGSCPEVAGIALLQRAQMMGSMMQTDYGGLNESAEATSATAEAKRGGAAWTAEEAEIIIQKLKRLSAKDVVQRFPEIKGPELKMHSAKWVRFGFHQCFKSRDGSGGCNGCMNFNHMYTELQYQGDVYQSREGDNNNLGILALGLELIYTDPKYPPRAPSLPVSFQESGKSRADLWAFAAQWGLIQALDYQKTACTGTRDRDKDTKNFWAAVGKFRDDKCSVNIPRMTFFTGRVDCPVDSNAKHPFISTKLETTPDNYANGPATLKFFREEFDFTAQETVAIMGAHSMGQFHGAISGFKYQWTRKQISNLNNQYYMNLATKPYSMVQGRCEVGWAHCGNEWHLRPLEWTKEGGPFLWFHSKDQTAISADVGLYYAFDVADDGRPIGCPGMPEQWSVPSGLNSPAARNRRGNLGTAIRYNMKPQCPKNEDVAVKATGDQKEKKMYDLVEDYASSHQKWMNDFIPAYEKMLQNGQHDLVRGPDVFTDVFPDVFTVA